MNISLIHLMSMQSLYICAFSHTPPGTFYVSAHLAAASPPPIVLYIKQHLPRGRCCFM